MGAEDSRRSYRWNRAREKQTAGHTGRPGILHHIQNENFQYHVLFLFFWLQDTCCRISVLQPGIKPRALQWKDWILTNRQPWNSQVLCILRTSFSKIIFIQFGFLWPSIAMSKMCRSDFSKWLRLHITLPVCMSLNHVWLFKIPCTIAPKALLSTGISRQEYWSRLSIPSGDLLLPLYVSPNWSLLTGEGPVQAELAVCSWGKLGPRAEPGNRLTTHPWGGCRI